MSFNLSKYEKNHGSNLQKTTSSRLAGSQSDNAVSSPICVIYRKCMLAGKRRITESKIIDLNSYLFLGQEFLQFFRRVVCKS